MADTGKMLDYLKELEENNNRDWYHAHREEQREANGEFLKLLEELTMEIGKMEPDVLRHRPEELTFKMVRDTRFSKDKSPYNPVFRAHISSGGKMPVPVGYFVVIRPGGRSFIGGGLFADMFKEATEMVRSSIAGRGQEWEAVIGAPSFREYFQVKGSKLKNVPKNYEKDHPQGEYLKYKSWYLEYPVPDEIVLQEARFLELAVKVCGAMKPFNDFLNQALTGFTMPAR